VDALLPMLFEGVGALLEMFAGCVSGEPRKKPRSRAREAAWIDEQLAQERLKKAPKVPQPEKSCTLRPSAPLQ